MAVENNAFLRKLFQAISFIGDRSRKCRPFREIVKTNREQNILDAAYLVVNRLASKCIQRLDLKGIAQTAAAIVCR